MSTKITNKQVKIISNVDFNEKEIENAIIDAEKNEITNLDIPTKVSDLENDSGYTTTADVNSEIIANSNSIDQELDENSYNAVTNNAIVKGIDVSKTSVVDSIVDTLPSGTLTLEQSVYNTTDNKIYKTTRNKIISSFNINGTVTTNAKGEITNIGNDNYLYKNFQYWVGISPIKLTFRPANNNYYSTNTQIFTISRADDNSVLFEIALNLLSPGTYDMYIRTRKRDGTVVDTASLRVGYNNRIVFETTKSCYVKVTVNSSLALIKYFDSLKSSNDIDDDFYYGIGGNIKISSVVVATSPQNVNKIGIGTLYGLDSVITYQYQSSPSNYYIVNEQYNSYIWDEGTLIEKNKLLCDATTNILYRYNGNELEEISPNLDKYQKKLTAGDNITISGEGYIGFSDTNYLKFINNITEPIPRVARDFWIKFKIDELNRNNTLIYSTYDTNKYCLLEITNENKLRCTYINSSGVLRTENGTHVFQANKEYWIMVTTDYYPQYIYFLEDNGYTIDSLPTDISAWTFDIESSYFEYMIVANINSPVYLGYNSDAINNFLKGSISECRIKNSGGHIIFTLSEAVESSSFINNGCLKGPVISAIVPEIEIDSQLSTTSENPVQNKVISNTLNEKLNFPTIVTDSGSSLPATTGYLLNDTFLNTTNKKIYKTEVGGYTYNNDVSLSSGTYEFIALTGEFVNTSSNIYRYNLLTSNYGWREEKEYKIHFKLSSGYNASLRYHIFKMTQATSASSNNTISVYMSNHKLYFESSHSSPGGSGYDKRKLLLDLTLEDNVEYYLKIVKHLDGTVTSTISSTSYDDDILKTETIDTETPDYYIYSSLGASIGYCQIAHYYQSGDVFFGTIYLADSIGDFVVPDLTSLFWDSGTSLTDKIEVADKTNGALYLYENSELVKIGGNLTKKVYTISADNTSTLDVSSDFTKVVDVLKNGVELAITDDYTISSGVITFVTALSTTDKITVKGE